MRILDVQHITNFSSVNLAASLNAPRNTLQILAVSANKNSVSLSQKNRKRVGRTNAIVHDASTRIERAPNGFSVKRYMDDLYRKIKDREAAFREELTKLRTEKAKTIGCCCLCDKHGNWDENVRAEDNNKLYCKQCYAEIHAPVVAFYKKQNSIAEKYPLEFDRMTAIVQAVRPLPVEAVTDNFASAVYGQTTFLDDDPKRPESVNPPESPDAFDPDQDPYDEPETKRVICTPATPEQALRLQIEYNLAKMNLPAAMYDTVMLAAQLVAKQLK